MKKKELPTRIFVVPIFTTVFLVSILFFGVFEPQPEPIWFLVYCLIYYPFGVFGAWLGVRKDRDSEQP